MIWYTERTVSSSSATVNSRFYAWKRKKFFVWNWIWKFMRYSFYDRVQFDYRAHSILGSWLSPLEMIQWKQHDRLLKRDFGLYIRFLIILSFGIISNKIALLLDRAMWNNGFLYNSYVGCFWELFSTLISLSNTTLFQRDSNEKIPFSK